MDRAELTPYLEHLRALPFVRSVRVLRDVPPGPEQADYEIAIRGPNEQVSMLVELKKSHVSPATVERWLGAGTTKRPRILFAPADKALRAPAYRALFALLADPNLVRAPVRELAGAAGVSRQAAFDIRPRLEALGVLYRTKTRFGWAPRGASKALDMFITGYATALRPQLTLGKYRTPGGDPGEIEKNVAQALESKDEARWGGGAAAMRLTRYYRGERTVLHMDELRSGFLKRIKAIPDKGGPLEIVRFPGRLGREGATHDTAHPLLVYAELMLEGQDRAAEAAQQILERWFPLERYA